MKKHYSFIPSSIPYPMEITKPYMRQFSSTFCYQMALAIHDGYKTIGIYGVDFRNGTLRERFVEWPGLLYWIGVATGKGIKVQLPDDALSHPYLYGLDYWRELDYSRSRVLLGIYRILKANTDGAKDKWRTK